MSLFGTNSPSAALILHTDGEKEGSEIMAIIILIATILLPPLGVALKHGLTATTLLNLVLTLLGFIPGLIHGLYVNYAR